MTDYAQSILNAASPESVFALGLSPYMPKPAAATGGLGRRPPMHPYAQMPPAYMGAAQSTPGPVSYEGAIRPAINVINNYTAPITGSKQSGQGRVTPTPAPIVGKEVKPETVIDRIRFVESTNNYQAKNPNGSASGAYQYTDGTWNNYGGYPSARVAPRDIQDRRIQEDIARRVMQFDGDVFKVIAAHYLPRDASDPSTWGRPAKVGKHTVDPVANYIRKVIKGTALEGQFDDYLQQYAE